MTPSLTDRPLDQSPEPAEAAYGAVVARARRELPEASFKMWFADLVPGDLQGGVLELIAPNAYVKRWLTGHYMELINGSVREVLGSRARVRLRSARAAGRSEPGGAGWQRHNELVGRVRVSMSVARSIGGSVPRSFPRSTMTDRVSTPNRPSTAAPSPRSL